MVALLLHVYDTVAWALGRSSGLCTLGDEVLVWFSTWSEVQVIADATATPFSLAFLLKFGNVCYYGDDLPRLSWRYAWQLS